jgi:putative transposase
VSSRTAGQSRTPSARRDFAAAGVKAPELARKHGVSEATLYNWRARYGGMEVSQLRRLKELEAENARLKRMYAELSLTHHALQDAVEKKL